MLHVHRDVEFVSGSPSTLLEHVSGRREPTPSSFLIGQSALECAERGRHAWPEGCRTNAAKVSETKCTKYRFLDARRGNPAPAGGSCGGSCEGVRQA